MFHLIFLTHHRTSLSPILGHFATMLAYIKATVFTSLVVGECALTMRPQLALAVLEWFTDTNLFTNRDRLRFPSAMFFYCVNMYSKSFTMGSKCCWECWNAKSTRDMASFGNPWCSHASHTTWTQRCNRPPRFSFTYDHTGSLLQKIASQILVLARDGQLEHTWNINRENGVQILGLGF